MRRKKYRSAGIVPILIVVVLIAAGGIWLYRSRPHLAPAPRAPVFETSPAAQQQLRGMLRVVKPPRDPELGVKANAVALMRTVAMYQWQENCAPAKCAYTLTWSAQRFDSHGFRTPAGHENAVAPFASAQFVAADLRIDDMQVDPALAMAQLAAVDFPVLASALPPNLAATFSVIDGVLYAGGDPSRPRPGMIRISYRIVPPGEVAVPGLRNGSRSE